MRSVMLLLLAASLPGVSVTARAGQAGADRETGAVRKVVETYLYAEEGEERKRTIFPQAKILSVDDTGTKVLETPVSKSGPKRKGRVTSRQRIVSIDVAESGASVKVETDLSSGERKLPKHIHYLSLLKVGGEWKIVGILMPPMKFPEAALK